MNRYVSENSLGGTRVGSALLALRYASVMEEVPARLSPRSLLPTIRAFGSLRVIAAQAIRELAEAEERSLDPLDRLRCEDEGRVR